MMANDLLSAKLQKDLDAKNKELEDLKAKTSPGAVESATLEGKRTGPVLSGSREEQEGQLAGLNLANVIYGQGLGQTGQDVQGIKGRLQSRVEQSGADPVTAAIMGQKASAMAGARRTLAQQGAKGAASAAALEDISRERDQEIAKSLYGQQRQSEQDYRSLIGNMISGSTSLMQGEKAANVQMPDAPSGGGLTVICSELFRQGYMPSNLYVRDHFYGDYLRLHNPNVLVGYHFWAKPIVALMKKSKLFTKIVSIPALKWAKHIAGEESSLFGHFCVHVGEPVCAIIGKVVSKFKENVCTQR
jgi:hypothetical protein